MKTASNNCHQADASAQKQMNNRDATVTDKDKIPTPQVKEHDPNVPGG
jgi:hypothetical protein